MGSLVKTADLARGRWQEILPILGIPKKFLSGRNMACPVCGGKDRFRFTDRYREGDYYCNQCGAGKGIALVMKVNSWDFPTAAKAVEQACGGDMRPIVPKQYIPEKSDTLRVLLDESIPFDDAMEMVADIQWRGQKSI